LFPPEQRLYQVMRDGRELKTTPQEPDTRKRAFIGVRACELAAIAIQDKVFTGGSFVDPHYKARRENLFLISVNCSDPAATCFSSSMGTGPEAETGFDLALTETIHAEAHEFVVETGSDRGNALLQSVNHREATEEDSNRRRAVVDQAIQRMGRSMQTGDLKELLYRNYGNARWDEVAQRCLSCANCTMVCPTCFCSTVEDVTDLTGDHAERWRKWDSCFTMDFSYLVGGSVRPSTSARYRQWMTHKLATWQDQFDVNGCVGCGRCITWCPVGIDITEEVAAIRDGEKNRAQETSVKED
jgi:ferredoxin